MNPSPLSRSSHALSRSRHLTRASPGGGCHMLISHPKQPTRHMDTAVFLHFTVSHYSTTSQPFTHSRNASFYFYAKPWHGNFRIEFEKSRFSKSQPKRLHRFPTVINCHTSSYIISITSRQMFSQVFSFSVSHHSTNSLKLFSVAARSSSTAATAITQLSITSFFPPP